MSIYVTSCWCVNVENVMRFIPNMIIRWWIVKRYVCRQSPDSLLSLLLECIGTGNVEIVAKSIVCWLLFQLWRKRSLGWLTILLADMMITAIDNQGWLTGWVNGVDNFVECDSFYDWETSTDAIWFASSELRPTELLQETVYCWSS